MYIVWAVLLILLACCCWVLTLLNLPGNWGMVGVTAVAWSSVGERLASAGADRTVR